MKTSDDTSNFEDWSELPPLEHGTELTPAQQALFVDF